MTKLLDMLDPLEKRRTAGFFEDFLDDLDTNRFAATLTDLGTAVVGDSPAGVLVLTASDGTVADNDEAYVEHVNEVFKFADDKPLLFEARIQYSEAATDDANVCLGLMDAVAADAILDNGGGPKASYSGAVIFKVDGGTVWQCETSIAGVQTTTASSRAAGGAAYQTLTIEFKPFSATQADVMFYVDGAQLLDSAGRAIKHTLTFTGATEMQAFAGIKNGSANNEILSIDYLACYQLR